MPRPASLILVAFLTGAPAPAQPETAEPRAPAIRIESHRLGATHMQLRWAAAPAGQEGSETYAPGAREIESAAGTPRVWLLVDPELACAGDEVRPGWLDALPLERVVGPDRADQTRHAIRAYLDEQLVPLADAGRDEWESRIQPTLDRRGRTLLDALTGDSRLLERTLGAVGLSAERAEATVELVPHSPAPGARTYRTPSGPVSIVAEDGLDDDTLLEVTMHEVIHAFDSSADHGSIFTELRDALAERGIAPTDPASRTVWHTLFFVHAAEMVRRDGRPGYVDYAERAGVYGRTGPAASTMRGLWPRVLDGELSRDEFVRRVVAQVPADAETGGPARHEPH